MLLKRATRLGSRLYPSCPNKFPLRVFLNTSSSRQSGLLSHPTSSEPESIVSNTMAANGANPDSNSLSSLTASLQHFGIGSLPSFPNAFPAHNPVDLYRAHIASLIAPIAGVTPEIVYPALQWPQTLDKGDLTLPVPALRLKGKKPDELAKDIADKVRMGLTNICI